MALRIKSNEAKALPNNVVVTHVGHETNDAGEPVYRVSLGGRDFFYFTKATAVELLKFIDEREGSETMTPEQERDVLDQWRKELADGDQAG